MAAIDALKSSEFFQGLEERHLSKISALCRGHSYREGEMIFRERDEAKEFCILTDGRVALEIEVRPVPDRPPIPTAVDVMTKGEGFGWSALVEPHVYTQSARCLTNCQILAINGGMLRRVMSDDTTLGYELMKRLAKLISVRLTNTRLRLISGLGLVLLGQELNQK